MNKRAVKKQRPDSLEQNREHTPVPLEKEIELAIAPLLQKNQAQQVVHRVTQVIMEHEAFSGPIAHPKHLREYEKILPGSAERIFAMAEKAQNHNQAMDKLLLDMSSKAAMTGMNSGFVALLLLIGSAVYSGMNGNNVLAGLLLAAGTISGAAKLLHGWNKGGKADE